MISRLRVIFLLTLLLLPRAAMGRTSSLDVATFKTATDSGYYLVTEGSKSMLRGEWSLGLYLDYFKDPISYVAGGQTFQVLSNVFMGHLTLAYAFTDWFEIGSGGDFGFLVEYQDPLTGVGDTSFRFGDSRMNFKLTLLDNTKAAVGIALVPFITFPSGDGDRFMGQNKVTGGGKLVLDTKRIANRLSFALNVGYLAHDSISLLTGTDIDDQFLFGAGLNWSLIKKRLDFVVDVYGSTILKDFFQSEVQTPLEADGALRLLLAQTQLAVTVGGGAGITQGVSTPKFRAFAGLSWIPPRILIEREVELREISLQSSEEVFVLSEQCPYEESNFDPQRDNPNCEEIYYLRNVSTQCPPADQYIKGKDNPNCEKVYGFNVVDYDEDAVPDFKDQCPSTPENRNDFQDDDGCPDVLPKVDIEKETVQVSPIYFDLGTANLRPASQENLRLLAGLLHAHEHQILKLSIIGHTDNRGPEKYNEELSADRARAVHDFLRSQGVDYRRLWYYGMGEKVPVASNKTKAGRAKNRRVEFKIIRWKEAPQDLKKELKKTFEGRK